MIKIPVRPGVITLLQVLKLSGVADVGSDAQQLVVDGFVSVNGLKESRKRRKLSVGDQIQIRAPRLKVHLKLVEKSDTTDEPA
ncbi:MAG: RNA-binding S4 domain-containing protein [bacterium]